MILFTEKLEPDPAFGRATSSLYTAVNDFELESVSLRLELCCCRYPNPTMLLAIHRHPPCSCGLEITYDYGLQRTYPSA